MRKFLIVALMTILSGLSYASVPEIKNYTKQQDLIEGQAKGIAITYQGKLLLAPDIQKYFDTERPFVWDVISDAKGNIFIATGDGAKLFRIDASGKSKVIAEWEDSEIYALALDGNDMLYAATSPDGKIYRFNKSTEPKLFAKLDVKYIWDIIFDAKNNCYVATGDSGSVYKISPDGKAELFFTSEETHIRSLAWDQKKNLIAGTYKNGYIYRIDATGKGFIIYDSDFEEINQICVSPQGIIFASALSSGKDFSFPTKEKEHDLSQKSQRSKKEQIIRISSGPLGQMPGLTTGIIKIQPNGVIKNIWKQNKDQVHSIYLAEDGTLLVGTGDNGRLYKIASDDGRTLLSNLDESQIVAFIPKNGGEKFFATSNLGVIYKLKSKHVRLGTYTSPVIDAGNIATWGSIYWEEKPVKGSSVQFYSRSGNAKKPNKTWSQWTKVKHKNDLGIITSPEARFLQWKVELKNKKGDSSPTVSDIKVSYLQKNLPPEITSLTVQAIRRKSASRYSSMVGDDYFSSSMKFESDGGLGDSMTKQSIRPVIPRRTPTNGFRRVTWKATDKNKDQLVYELQYKHKNGKDWWTLKKGLTRSSHTWDSKVMPDGIYQLKLIVSDEKSNPINTAKKAEKVSDFFIVDNRGPTVDKIAAEKVGSDSLQVSFSVIDALSNVKKVQFSVNAQDWKWVYPQDLICDSKQEKFYFRIKLPEKGFRSIVIKATDEADNIGYGHLFVKD